MSDILHNVDFGFSEVNGGKRKTKKPYEQPELTVTRFDFDSMMSSTGIKPKYSVTVENGVAGDDFWNDDDE